MEENMEAIDRMRAHGETLRRGAPHQQSIGDDIVRLCDLAAARPPMQSNNSLQEITDRGKEIGRLTEDNRQLRASVGLLTDANVALEKDLEALKTVKLDNEVRVKALLFIARSRFAPDDNPFMVLLRKTARDALDEAGIDWAETDPAQLTLPPMEPMSAAATPKGGRKAK